MALTDNAPVYVTRKTADGWTGSYYLPFWMTLTALLLAWLNIVAWGALGLYEAARIVF